MDRVACGCGGGVANFDLVGAGIVGRDGCHHEAWAGIETEPGRGSGIS